LNPTRAQWERAQAKYNALSRKLDDHEIAMHVKYGNESWQSRAEKGKRDKLRAQRDKVSDQIFTWLSTMTDRNWSSGVPSDWICSALSYTDATKSSAVALSVTPPIAYGHTRPIQ
jgi:hypothetical protein